VRNARSGVRPHQTTAYNRDCSTFGATELSHGAFAAWTRCGSGNACVRSRNRGGGSNARANLDFPESYKSALLSAIESIDLVKVKQAIGWFQEARAAGKQIFVCGNGGSASTASHFACDIGKGASFNRGSRFRITALTDHTATLTAYANDVGYDSVFVEQLKNFAGPGDLFMAISGSGNSPNMLRAMEFANQAGCRTLALTGRDGGLLGPMAQLNIHIAAPHMGRIEDAHMVVCHMIGYYFMDEER
jgi:D-sedoheptulose 7-phosphate isomerase